MTQPDRKTLTITLLLALALSLGISYTRYLVSRDSAIFPKSTTLLTPFDVFTPSISVNVKTGTSSEGVSFSPLAELGNVALLAGVSALLWTGFKRSRSKKLA